MNAYFDLANLRSLSKLGGHQDFTSCIDMLRQNFNIHFNFDKETVEQEKKKSKQSIMTLLKSLTRNRTTGDSIVWNDSYPPRPLNEELYSSMTNEHLTSLYFVDDKNIDTMMQQGNLLFASEGNEINIISNLFIDGRNIPTKKYSIREMNNWQVIEDNTSPCTDIIIVDPYLFSQSDILYEFNAYKIIEHLSKGHKVCVVIFTYPRYKDGDVYIDCPFNTITRQLKTRMGENLNLTFVIIPNGDKKEHDRTIITNYKMYDSGDSFTYFNNKSENNSHGKWFHVSSHGDRDNRNLCFQYLNELQLLIDSQKSGLNSIIGDKKSNFLKFS